MALFGTSGIRRLADRDLVELSLQVGLAVGSIYKKVVIGRDTRTSGPAILHALTAGLLAAGARCSDAGILPTPSVAYVTRQFDTGIMITASHNPPQYNGLKLLNPDGSAFSVGQQKQIEDLITAHKASGVGWDRMTDLTAFPGAVEQHIAAIRRLVPGTYPLKVVVDCGCGAAFQITPAMLSALGCSVIPLNCSANGIFPHDVEPVAANLGDLMAAVKAHGAALGLAHDGDADRVMAVDDLGRFIPGDKLLVMLSQDAETRAIVTTIDASMCIEEWGLQVERTPVGDPYVSEALKKGATFGGEPSGAWVFPAISLCPDGIYGAARIVHIASRHRLSALVDSIPAYPVIRGNVAGRINELRNLNQLLVDRLHPASIDTIDGLKMNFKDGWLLIRPSGTEPKIRVTSEARAEDIARRQYESAAAIISDYLREHTL
jgi:phosphoglucosamine mutase